MKRAALRRVPVVLKLRRREHSVLLGAVLATRQREHEGLSPFEPHYSQLTFPATSNFRYRDFSLRLARLYTEARKVITPM